MREVREVMKEGRGRKRGMGRGEEGKEVNMESERREGRRKRGMGRREEGKGKWKVGRRGSEGMEGERKGRE